ncbi:hypothetical protein F5Y00DRAFT_226824 [Daldinia vernicosa]|uniref:uncharacterized protein n=1 Tax=Daldinia vernicosa TaxID=114800 RepID=UPI0020089F60|nr:uncharacterized protein F5Y00DRAFT_226824 [Daldinia vernicosa]KAI0852514.1 hypothetical protein F5Y00DRAFT_226824 [Daldinia vernicosa]
MEELDGQDQDSLAGKKFNKRDLLAALESIRHKGAPLSLSPIPRIDPEIFVQDIGIIKVPLSEIQARQLVAMSHQAHYGKGSESIIDTPVRNTWELNPDQFEIRAPTWQNCLDKILAEVAKRLDIASPISAELYKMLLYEKGAMSKSHIDTEKIPGMFGTLVISLPSPHRGGGMVLEHQRVWQTFGTSQHDMSWISWFSDVSHDVLPVTWGYCWILTYNLMVDPASTVPAAISSASNEALRTALRLWLRAIDNGSENLLPLCYVLDHKYTDLSFRRLKGVDFNRVKCLRMMCEELDFDFFLADIEKEESGTIENDGYDYYREEEEDEDDDVDYHPLGEVRDVSYQLTYVFNSDGYHLASNMLLDEYRVLQLEHPFSDEPDAEDYERSRGNPRSEATHWYRGSALVIVPYEGTVSFLTSNYPGGFNEHSAGHDYFIDLFNFFISQCEKSPRKALRLDQLYEFLIANFESRYPMPLTEDQLLDVLLLSIHSSESRLLDLFLAKNTQPPPIKFFTWIRKAFDSSAISISNFEKLFRHAFSLQPTIHRRWEALCEVNEDLEEGEGKLRNIVSQAVDECLETCRQKRFQEEDGKTLFRILYYHQHSDLETAVIRVVEDLGWSTAFVLGFLHSFRLQILKNDTQAVYERVALAALKKLDLASLTAAEIPQAETGAINVHYKDARGPEYVTYRSMLKFISTLIELKLQSHLDMLAKQVVSQANKVKTREFDTLWIPLLHGLFLVFEKSKVPLPAPYWTQIYQNIFKAYLLNYVREQPVEPTLSRRALNPCCRGCEPVNEFLVDPTKRSSRFKASRHWREHVLYRLSEAHVDHEASTEYVNNTPILIISKTTSQYNAEANSWWTRRLHVESQFETFNPDMLRAVLQDQYDDIINMKLIERQQPVTSNAYATSVPSQSQQPLATGSYEDQLAMINAEIARRAGSSSITPNPSTVPKPPVTYSTAVGGGPARPAPRSTPKRSMLDVSRSISESARKRALQNRSSPSTRRDHGASSPVGGGGGGVTPSRPTQTIPNPIAGAKRKYIDVIDLTADD